MIYNKPSIEEIERVLERYLPKEKTGAVYLFGSYSTEFFDDDSDIDLAWFCKDVDYSTRYILEDKLERELGREVDLLCANELDDFMKYTALAGTPIWYMSREFADWFDDNVYEINNESELIFRLYNTVFGDKEDFYDC